MNKARKVDLLYKKAKGQNMNASAEEVHEMKKYKVDCGENSFYATKANISQYVTAVDNGYRLSFYDWCMNNKKADRRRKGSSEEDIAGFNREQSAAAIFIGWLIWGIAIYWMLHGAMSVGACAIAGAIVSVILLKCSRKNAAFTVFLLPIILAVLFGG